MKSVIALLFCATVITSCGKMKCKESPKDDCFCTMEYNPVCGCNDVTYGNACTANCNGITEYIQGECP